MVFSCSRSLSSGVMIPTLGNPSPHSKHFFVLSIVWLGMSHYFVCSVVHNLHTPYWVYLSGTTDLLWVPVIGSLILNPQE